MPRHLYDDFILKRIELKPCKAGSGQTGERYYASFGCPHCDAEVDVIHSLISSKKGAACSTHLKKCVAYQAKQGTVASSSPAHASAPTSTKNNLTVEDVRGVVRESEARA